MYSVVGRSLSIRPLGPGKSRITAFELWQSHEKYCLEPDESLVRCRAYIEPAKLTI